MLIGCINTIAIYKFWVSRIFPETAWWVMNSHQATYQHYVNYGFQRWNRLAALIGPPDDACVQPNFGFSLMKGLAAVVEPSGDASSLARLWVFLCCGKILVGAKSSPTCLLMN